MGASLNYLSSGFTESVYQYIAGGLAEIVLLSVVIRLSDEPYKINAVKMYMVDYLDNICAFRLKKQKSSERESIDVIAAENSAKPVFQTGGQEKETGEIQAVPVSKAAAGKARAKGILRGDLKEEQQAAEDQAEVKKEPKLSINIEGEPREAEKGEAARQAVRRTVNEKSADDDRPVLREETIRQILEEFLA